MKKFKVSLTPLPVAAPVVEEEEPTEPVEPPAPVITPKWVIPSTTDGHDDYYADSIDGAIFTWECYEESTDLFLINNKPIGLHAILEGATGDVAWALTSYPQYNFFFSKAWVSFGPVLAPIEEYYPAHAFFSHPAGTYEFTATHNGVDYVFTMILQELDGYP